jgi:hypothetical protein
LYQKLGLTDKVLKHYEYPNKYNVEDSKPDPQKIATNYNSIGNIVVTLGKWTKQKKIIAMYCIHS